MRASGLATVVLLPAVLLATSPAAAQQERPDIAVVLEIGERYVIPDDDVASYSQSGPGIFDVEVDGERRVVLIGRRPGRNTILFVLEGGGQRRYVVTVRHPDDPPLDP